jgi:hypothetical protein
MSPKLVLDYSPDDTNNWIEYVCDLSKVPVLVHVGPDWFIMFIEQQPQSSLGPGAEG